jgi:hypothetical protein
MKTIKNQNKNGRPKKDEADRKKYKLTVKMETKEYFSFKAKVRSSGLTQSEYIRRCIAKSEVKQRLTSEHLGATSGSLQVWQITSTRLPAKLIRRDMWKSIQNVYSKINEFLRRKI